MTITSTNKMPVTITGATASTELIYNGQAQTGYTGTLVIQNDSVPVTELVTTYTGRNSTSYDSTTAPGGTGDYTLVISVADSNDMYEGQSAGIEFTIAPASITIKAKDISVSMWVTPLLYWAHHTIL